MNLITDQIDSSFIVYYFIIIKRVMIFVFHHILFTFFFKLLLVGVFFCVCYRFVNVDGMLLFTGFHRVASTPMAIFIFVVVVVLCFFIYAYSRQMNTKRCYSIHAGTVGPEIDLIHRMETLIWNLIECGNEMGWKHLAGENLLALMWPMYSIVKRTAAAPVFFLYMYTLW